MNRTETKTTTEAFEIWNDVQLGGIWGGEDGQPTISKGGEGPGDLTVTEVTGETVNLHLPDHLADYFIHRPLLTEDSSTIEDMVHNGYDH